MLVIVAEILSPIGKLTDHVDGRWNRQNGQQCGYRSEDVEGILVLHERDDEVEHGDSNESKDVNQVRGAEKGSVKV